MFYKDIGVESCNKRDAKVTGKKLGANLISSVKNTSVPECISKL